ncbi:MAG TPA: hypothetical protein VH143_11815 [Kofleriaceae bacterium]|jgi:hypothetical protein|nr:hypothetical protein [Kofleriaceae bacterium]
MTAIDITKLANVVGGQQANLAAQGQSTINYNNCLGSATSKAQSATNGIFGKVQSGALTPTQGVSQGVGVNRQLRSDVAACDVANPIPQ